MIGGQMPAWCKALTQKNRQLNFQKPSVSLYMEKVFSCLETCVMYWGRGVFRCGTGEAAWSQWGWGCSFSGVNVLFSTGLF